MIEEFKEHFCVNRIDVKVDPVNDFLYFAYGDNKGEVAIINIPKNPVISVVSNMAGQLFLLLHELEDVGKVNFTRKKYSSDKGIAKKQQHIQHKRKTSFWDYENEQMFEDSSDPMDDYFNNVWNKDETDSGLADAFEGDSSAYDRW